MEFPEKMRLELRRKEWRAFRRYVLNTAEVTDYRDLHELTQKLLAAPRSAGSGDPVMEFFCEAIKAALWSAHQDPKRKEIHEDDLPKDC